MEREAPTGTVKLRSGADWPKLLLILLILAIGYFLWGFANNYSNNIYYQTSPLTEIFTSFRLAIDLVLMIGLTLTLVLMKTRGKNIR